ncbi:undecaprenyldiphospho-muramoylpentapeptide beta-N-acetylglucosaminyltransferase [Rhodospirillum rubrum]|uniref:UDP-N-acetylglucosamine--N-acetylmuramyl-(pentapeptide) pyrophosphoryl-undecaprenol N-acetylglucosamine transferase n=1 Tax=Rhodospirillum rubrum (strain ATCC 11170 / ATH 1.1.1 / DSM 467 / LMG 4362 / NCIMB 8255 / S1) TaxID=269796 RepID=MURG_RHORT|nr:undecaprenyldiphospho-muramoylpentapeptide beta-N-acetylglucosaminyltransferase [Rhodospirillum rubrum]Q2RVU4.1 RecName: Full=UDP-N-acetylglucosamine--N-acetylmuramyl-(pentapeptide) pyrophosphoryl-undecaprenol N-acetylglucosamine transferase; AltName: Full=Undecaprenyl-PP-MurNAc-pentapeptide-UDPGlcNAc GlcNAc transferase [Rhodospirillum rubrum ATCC 11170]ABC21751.1 UDP-N-acetylglucosamine--N-acetylmuramyl-(pentapeptide) pyrophosphoryl-undecaprenol N-acetylglucosamine transferase [Rhodospirillum
MNASMPRDGALLVNAPLHIALAAGGTGGHVFPAEALAGELIRRGHKLTLITDKRGHVYGGTLGLLDTKRILAGGVAGRGVIGRLRGMIELAMGSLQAYGLLRRLRPDVVVGFGGYASVPTMLAAIRLKLPTVVHEQNAVPGRANRLLAARVSRYAVSFARAERPRGARPVVVGMPVRPSVLALRGEGYDAPRPGLDFRLLITGGSQGARVFATLVPQALALLSPAHRARLRVTQQCRPEDIEAVRATYEAQGIDALLSAFFSDLPERLRDAHLVICRSGASTVGELAALGRPAILVPFPHAIDDHQTANARGLDEVGGGWLMPQAALTPQALAERLGELMDDPDVLVRAAQCARGAGVPDAAVRLADLVSATADHRVPEMPPKEISA